LVASEDVVSGDEWSAPTQSPALQRQADDASASPAEPAPAASTATATTAPIAGPAAIGPPSDADIDTWTRALYPSFRRRFCQDLLLDRERSGYSTDIRY
jgi:hypothetical protein